MRFIQLFWIIYNGTMFTWVKKHVMYKVRCHGNDQEMEVKIAVFVKYGIVPV